MSTYPSSSMVHRGRREPPFFRAKFRPPSRPRHFVRRHRLLTLLDDLTDYPVTAIVAPAGAGKTVLAADWLSRCQRPSVWLTLDSADRDPTELWRSLGAVLDLLAPHLPAPRTGSDGAGRTSPGEDLSGLLARALRSTDGADEAVLVVDNLDRVDDDPAACDLLAALVEHRPAWLHLLLLSRRRPPLQVDRLRASGDLADIHFGTLRFSQDEAVRLLTRLCPDLPSEDLAAAAERANGWAAAVQLTALAIRSHRSRAHPPALGSGSPGAERLVDEYLWEEVLRPERSELVGLLLCTAVVGRINYGLAEALTRRPDAGDLLEQAEAAGLFVTALDGGWFEVHSLVRDMLVTRLERRWPDGLRELHARAAHWFEDVGDPSMALDHWQRAERPIDALRVLSEVSLPLVEAGRSARVVEAVELIPPELAAANPVDAIRLAWCQLAAGQSAFPDAVVLAEASALGAPAPVPSRVETLNAVSSWLRADWRRAAAVAHRALREPPATDDPLERFGWHLVSSGVALDERWDDGLPAVGEARAACVKDPASRWAFEGTRAVGLALAGRPLDALRVADNARPAAATGRYETLRVQLALTEAMVARELDRRDEAAGLLESLAHASTYPDPVLQLVAQLELLRLRMSTGELAEASARLDEAEELQASLGRLGVLDVAAAAVEAPPCDLVARAGVELALAGDDPASAARWSAQVSDPFWGPIGEGKIHLARGEWEAAIRTVRRALPRSPRHQVVSGLVLARALAPEDRSAATEAVIAALDLAAGRALLRTVAAEGAPVLELIELAAGRVPDTWMDRLRHALVPVWSSREAQRPIEDLTDRERDVLRLLPSRLTLAEIASELYVSQNTLKFHLRAIYRKLGVVSRAQAVDSARHTRLLPRG